MTNSHTWGDSVWIHNHVWHNSFHSERQIFLAICHTTGTFLSMTWGKLITDLRHFNSAHFNFDKAFIFIVGSKNNLINIAFFRMLQRNWLIFERFLLVILVLIKAFTVVFVFKHVVLRRRYCFADNYVVTTHLICWTYNSISIKFFICSMLEPASFLWLRYTNSFHISLGLCVSTVKHASEEAPINCRLIQHNWIFLVVATVTSNRNYTVTPSGQLFKSKVLHTSSCDKRFLRVIQQVS